MGEDLRLDELCVRDDQEEFLLTALKGSSFKYSVELGQKWGSEKKDLIYTLKRREMKFFLYSLLSVANKNTITFKCAQNAYLKLLVDQKKGKIK